MPKILVLKHKKTRYDDLGLLRKTFLRNGFDLEERCSFAGDIVPASLDGYDGLVVMGGKMGVYENHPEINEEMRLMDRVLTAGNPKPVFGICLGCQMLATVAGGEVTQGKKGFEAGFSPVKVIAKDPLFGKELDDALVYQWHQDTFSVAPAAHNLMSSPVYDNQAIRFGMYGYGVQFHPEVDTTIIRAWHQDVDEKDEIPDGKSSMEEDLSVAKEALPKIERWLDRFVHDFYQTDV